MAKGPNDWEWQVGPATHEWNAAADPVLTGLETGGRGETPISGHQGAEPFVAKPAPESPARTEQLMEEVCDRENLRRAWKHVRRNKGSPGVDGMTIDDARDYLCEHWPSMRAQLHAGTYQPQQIKRVEIPKSQSR